MFTELKKWEFDRSNDGSCAMCQNVLTSFLVYYHNACFYLPLYPYINNRFSYDFKTFNPKHTLQKNFTINSLSNKPQILKYNCRQKFFPATCSLKETVNLTLIFPLLQNSIIESQPVIKQTTNSQIKLQAKVFFQQTACSKKQFILPLFSIASKVHS